VKHLAFAMFVALIVQNLTGLGSAMAQTATSDTALEQITVTAQRRAQDIQTVPISITALSGEALSNAGVSDMHDLQSVTPGLNFTVQGAFAQPAIRGVSSEGTTAGNEANIAVYLDGVYQPAQFGNLFELPDVDNVQVLKGPQGTLYGRNATGGAILITTEQPDFKARAHFTVSDGYYNYGGNDVEFKGFATGSIIDSVLAGSLAVGFKNTDGYSRNIYTDKSAGEIKSNTVRGKLLFQPADDIKVVLTAFFSHRLDGSVYAYFNQTPLAAVAAGGFPLPSKPYDVSLNVNALADTEVYGTNLNATLDTAIGTISSISSFEHVASNLLIDADMSAAPIFLYHFFQPNKTWSEELNFASHQFGPVSFEAGILVIHPEEKYNPIVVKATLDGPSFFTDYATSTTTSTSGFAEVNYNISEQLRLIGGFRYTSDKVRYDGATTPAEVEIASTTFSGLTSRGSVMYYLTDNTNVYFTFSQGFKAGLFDTTSFSDIPIKPEKINSYEVGLKARPLPTLTVAAAAYLYDITNLQLQQTNSQGLAAPSNAAAARIEGIDFETSWKPIDRLTLSGGFTYLPVAKYENYAYAPAFVADPVSGGATNIVIPDASGRRLIKAPDWQGNIAANYATEVSWGELSASANLMFMTHYSYDLNDSVTQRSYEMLNARIAWSPSGSAAYRFSLWGKNLTNKATILTYLENADALGYALAPPREIGLSIDVKL
jgi:iron complex outermembrane receptor protein